jgi:hypothetical protein
MGWAECTVELYEITEGIPILVWNVCEYVLAFLWPAAQTVALRRDPSILRAPYLDIL